MHASPNHPPSARRRTPATHSGFSLLELLIVIAVIGLLIGILVPVVSKALDTAYRSQSQTQLAGIQQAVTAFHTDFNYDPPLLSSIQPGTGALTPETSPLAAGISPSDVTATSQATRAAYRKARFMSQVTLPAYLCGIGALDGQMYDSASMPNVLSPLSSKNNSYNVDAAQDGAPGPGIRSPGSFKCWLQAQNGPTGAQLAHQPAKTGRIYGPYIDPASLGSLLQRVEVDPDTMLAKPGSGYFMYQFVDRYGSPIRYYRGWPTKDENGKPTAKYIPVELRSVEGVQYAMNPAGDPPDENAVINAGYILLAAAAKPEFYNDGGSNKSLIPYGDVVLDDASVAVKVMDIESNTAADTEFDGPSFGSGSATPHDMLLKFLKNNVKLTGQ